MSNQPVNHHLLTHDYRSSMQRAAFSYLVRHENQYLSDSDRLFDNCVHYLNTGLDVPGFLAQKLACNAWGELQEKFAHTHLHPI